MSDADREEAEWLTRVGAEGEEAPFVDLYRRYEGRIYGIGLRMLGDRALAEELVQETFVRLWRSAGGYRADRGTVRAYVLAIARRTAITLWRRPSSRPLLPEQELEDPATADDPVEAIVLAVTVRDAMSRLSAEHRQVLELVVERDLTKAQVAERLGLPVGTVKSRAHYALKALHVALGERGADV